MATVSKPLPRPIRHYQALSDGRLLSYCTFTGSLEEDGKPPPCPILYLHGFPGCGNEGAMITTAATEQNCKVYAIDRPGFGFSMPLPVEDCATADSWIKAIVRDIEDFTVKMKWAEYGIVGVSGGGPYALALLESYLSRLYSESGVVAQQPKLKGVSIGAGVCCSAGVDDMMKSNQQLFKIASLINANGFLGKILWNVLHFQLSLQRFLIQTLPTRWLLFLSSFAFKSLPQADQHVIKDENKLSVLMESVKVSMQQAAKPSVYEACALFQSNFGFEDSLRQLWKKQHPLKPQVTVYQGQVDVNVPPNHARYIYENLLSGKEKDDNNNEKSLAKLVEYPDLGHISLVTARAKELVTSACGN